MTTGITTAAEAEARPAPPGAGGRASRTAPRPRRLTLLLVLLAVLFGVVGPLILSAYTGGLSIPHNDTWAFSRSAQIFAHTGHIELFNWNAMALVGMFVPLGPLGGSITVQAFYIVALTLITLAASFDLLRTHCGPHRAALGLLVLTLWPGFGLISTTLMTDIPALAAVTVTLALGRRALDRGSFPLLSLAALVGLWGFTVREQVIAAPLGVFAAALLRPEFRTKKALMRFAALGTVVAVAAGVFELWRRGLPGGGSPSFDVEHFHGLHSVLVATADGWLLLGLILSPLVLLAVRPLRWRRREQIAGGVTFLILTCGALWEGVQLPPNFISVRGSYAPAFLDYRPDVIPQTVFDLLIPIGCVSGALLAGLTVRQIRRLRPEFLIYALVMAGGTLLELVEGQGLFDRYVLPLALPLIAVVLTEPIKSIRASRVTLAGLAGLLVATVTTLMTANAFAFDAATWRAAQAVVASGKAGPAYVDAGLDWTGYYSPSGMRDWVDPYALPGIYLDSPRMTHDQPCYVVASRPQDVPLWSLDSTEQYRVYGMFGNKEDVFVYRTYAANCH